MTIKELKDLIELDLIRKQLLFNEMSEKKYYHLQPNYFKEYYQPYLKKITKKW